MNAILATIVYPNGYWVRYRRIDNEHMRAEWSYGARFRQPLDWLNGFLADARHSGYIVQEGP